MVTSSSKDNKDTSPVDAKPATPVTAKEKNSDKDRAYQDVTDSQGDDDSDTHICQAMQTAAKLRASAKERPATESACGEMDSRKTKRLKRLQAQLSYDYKDEPALWGKRL